MTIDKIIVTQEELGDLYQELRTDIRTRYKGRLQEAADKLGIKFQYLSDMLHGRRNINNEMLEKMRKL